MAEIYKCISCDDYVGQDEELCVKCANSDETDLEVWSRYLIDEEIGDVSEDRLNDIGVNVMWADDIKYYSKRRHNN